MTLADLSPMELVDLVADGNWRELTVEQAQEADRLLKAHQAAVAGLEIELEKAARELVAT